MKNNIFKMFRYFYLICIIVFGLIAIIGSNGDSGDNGNGGTTTGPTATITSPADGSTYTEGDTITFTGFGSDTGDGILTDSSLVWTSSLNDQIGTGTSFTRNDLYAGSHLITLTAIDSEGATGSNMVNITINQISSAPSAPTNVASTAGDEQVTISWDSVSGATNYNIYWSTSSGVTIGTGTEISGITTTSYTHSGRTNGTTYYYVVTAENDYGESDESSEVSATPSATDTAPSITDVELLRWDGSEWVESDVFYIGDYANFYVYATDPDLNMTTLWVSQYYPNTSDTPYYGPDEFLLPSQSATDMYYYLIESIIIDGPAGNWRIEFQIEDETNKMSNVFTKYTVTYE